MLPLGVSLLRVLALLLALALLSALLPALRVAPAFAQGERAVQVGLYHPRPRLCLGDEPAQRDLRVLWMAYGVGDVPARRLDWPWFYRASAADPAPDPASNGMASSGTALPEGLALALDTQALWERPLYRVQGAHPKLADPPATSPRAGAARDGLAAWRRWTRERLPGVRAEDRREARPRGEQFLVPSPTMDPFFASRLAGSRVLPFRLGRNGRQPADLCRDWPAGVTFEPTPEGAGEPAPLTYVLRGVRGGDAAPFVLSAYRERRALWRDYLLGRLDALLLEGPDLDEALPRLRAAQVGAWGVLAGTQQVVLRFHPALAARLGVEGRRALSLALPREQLAQVDGPGRFAAPTAFLAPVQAPEALEPAEALGWDSSQARRLWLARAAGGAAGASGASPEAAAAGVIPPAPSPGLPPELSELRLAVLSHPLLERLAQRIQAQWHRTLNGTVRVQVWPFDQFERLLSAGEADLLLDVVELDDGSLQDLWLESLRALAAPLDAPPARWEAALREGLPYLPVLGSVHTVLLRPGAPAGLLERVCPGCVPAPPPRRLAPEPTERTEPQG